MSRPAVTVLLPVRAYRPEYLQQAVGSILGQTNPDWLLLVIVDPPQLAGFRSRWESLFSDPRIEIVANEGRKLAGKLNTGMRLARTDFAAVLFADDLWADDAVAVLTERIQRHPEADLFHSARRFVDDRGRPISSVHPSRIAVSHADFLEGAPVKHLICWRIEKALSFGGMDESLNSIGADDFDFPWTMHDHGAELVAVPECLYIARDHRQYFRLTTHVPRRTQERELRRIMRKHGAGRRAIRRRIAIARDSYLRQCLYANRFDRWLKRRRGFDPHLGWREPFA
jgi:glycosyltransferase involved in cell wall biosynthesis